MKYKMIVSDFDGTLLRSDNTISEVTKKAIEEYISLGGIFTISTGRSHGSIFKRLKDVGLEKVSIPLMSFQGALCADNVSGEVFMRKTMPNDVVIEILTEAERLNIYAHIYGVDNMVDDQIYVNKITAMTREYCKSCDLFATEVGNLIEFVKTNNPLIPKVLMIPNKGTMLEMEKHFEKMFKDKAQVFSSDPVLLEAVGLTAGKGNGIIETGKRLNVSPNEIIAIGDGMNDLTMIRAAGLGVAVANAREELKLEAKYITKSNNEDGVAEVIYKAIKGEI